MRNHSLAVLVLAVGLTVTTMFQPAYAADPTFAPQDIGSPAIPGSVAAVAGGYNITAGGTNTFGAGDQFTFNYQQVTGDFDFKIRVAGLTLADAWSKAGLMARETLVTNSAYAAAFATPSVSGAFFQWRASTGGAPLSGGAYPVNYPNTWLRLRRTANLFTSYTSMDGDAWYLLGSATIPMSASAYIGMAVSASAPNGSVVATTTAQFRDFQTAINGVVVPYAPESEPAGPSSRLTPFAITEIMYNPLPSSNSVGALEFVELYNSNPFFEEISGYQLSGNIDFTFPPGTFLQAGAYVVIARNPAAVKAQYTNLIDFNGYAGVMNAGYSNSLPGSGTLRLRNKENHILIEVPYSNKAPWPVAADGAGHSLVLARASYGERDPFAWGISDKVGGSPGAADPQSASPLRNVVINEFFANSESSDPDFIELYNHSNRDVDVTGCTLSDAPDTNQRSSGLKSTKFSPPRRSVVGSANVRIAVGSTTS